MATTLNFPNSRAIALPAQNAQAILPGQIGQPSVRLHVPTGMTVRVEYTFSNDTVGISANSGTIDWVASKYGDKVGPTLETLDECVAARLTLMTATPGSVFLLSN